MAEKGLNESSSNETKQDKPNSELTTQNEAPKCPLSAFLYYELEVSTSGYAGSTN